jgi:ABC-type transport system involved in cytochrome c biogenesis permease subunit
LAGTAEHLVVRVVDRVPADLIPGLTAYQSVVLLAGFLATLLFIGAGKLSGSPFLRLLMPWAIGFLGLATIYFMFVSDLSDKVAAGAGAKSSGSLVHQFQDKGKDLAEKKQERLKQVDQFAGQE